MQSLWLCVRCGAAAAALAFGASAATGGPLADAAERAETRLQAGETVRALEALDEAVAAVWDEAPLTFRTWSMVDQAEGYGIYEPRAEGPFRPGETMRVYVEPVGFAYGGAAELHEVALAADLSIETPGGQVLAEAKDMFSVGVPSRNRIREFNVTFSFAVPELAPGPYRAVFTVRDRHSDKEGTFAVPFEVEAQ